MKFSFVITPEVAKRALQGNLHKVTSNIENGLEQLQDSMLVDYIVTPFRDPLNTVKLFSWISFSQEN